MDGEPLPDLRLRNFLKILGVIDRTVLPRKVLIADGPRNLALMVARQRAFRPEWREPVSAGLLQSLALAIIDIAGSDRQVEIRVEAAPAPPVEGIGVTAAQIVNGQASSPGGEEGGEPLGFSFGENGWPLAVPPGASLAMLSVAAGFASAMSAWQRRHQGEVAAPMLVLGVSSAGTPEMSVSVGDGIVVARAGLAQLGQVVSQWRLRRKTQTGG